MRCPHCAGQIQESSRFCGICGGRVEASQVAPAPAAPGPAASPSLFELPVSKGARTARVAFILVLDLILLGAGAAMIFSYLDKRSEASEARRSRPSPVSEASVEIPLPTPMPGESVAVSEGNTHTQTLGRPRSRVRSKLPEPRERSSKASSTSAPAPAIAVAPASASAATPTSASEPAPRAEDDGVIPAEGMGPDAVVADPEDQIMEKLTRQVARIVGSSEKRALLQRCYRNVAKASGSVSGKVVIRFSLMPDGRATNVSSTTNTSGSDTLAECVVALFESWTFPTHDAGKPLTFLWPLVFKAPK